MDRPIHLSASLRLGMLARLACIAVVAAMLGPAAEGVHLRAGVWTLLLPAPFPAWIAAAYFGAFLGLGLGLIPLERRAALPSISLCVAAAEAALVVGLFLAPPLLHSHELLLTCLLCMWLGTRLTLARATGDLTLAGAAMALDVAVEGLLIGIGLYRYENAGYLPVPLWLAPLWGGLALSLRRLFRIVLPPSK